MKHTPNTEQAKAQRQTGEGDASMKKTKRTERSNEPYEVVAGKLTRLAQGIDVDGTLLQDCADRGLLPLDLVSSFHMALFLFRVVPSAQNAQRSYGVPASVLIAKAAYESGWGSSDLARKHGEYFDAASGNFRSSHDEGVKLSFLKEAERLATDPKFRAEMRYAGTALLYLSVLCKKGLGDDLYYSDLSSLIIEYGLEECDQAALFPPGGYDRATHHLVANKPMYKKT